MKRPVLKSLYLSISLVLRIREACLMPSSPRKTAQKNVPGSFQSFRVFWRCELCCCRRPAILVSPTTNWSFWVYDLYLWFLVLGLRCALPGANDLNRQGRGGNYRSLAFGRLLPQPRHSRLRFSSYDLLTTRSDLTAVISSVTNMPVICTALFGARID